jgi:valyl-tRNA synthetase
MSKRTAFRWNKVLLYNQDEDVLDTWFSAGLWPFSIMGWPKKTADMDAFFPNSLLETGWDILFFWVARMVMMSLKLTGQVPFKQVFCHAMVRDAHGRKMSKSLGNVIDPLDVIHGITLKELNQQLDNGNLDPREVERAKLVQQQDFPNGIPECGTDALRFALLAYTSSGRDINLDILRVDGYSKFCNKLWNATRFAHMKLGKDYKPRDTDALTGKETLAGKWILHKLTKTITETTKYLEEMNFMQATQSVHQFWLYDLCDVYLEVCKPVFDGPDEEAKAAAQDVLYICLDQGLKLLHPFMPFVTEELYQRLNRRPNDKVPSIMICQFPQHKNEWYSEQTERDFEYINSVVRSSRGLMTDYNLKKNAKLYIESIEKKALLEQQRDIVKGLVRCEELSVVDVAPPGCAVSTLVPGTSVYLLVKGLVDIESEISKLETKKVKVQTLCDALKKKTNIDGYKNVPEEVKQKDAEKLASYNQEIETFEKSIIQFQKLAL